MTDSTHFVGDDCHPPHEQKPTDYVPRSAGVEFGHHLLAPPVRADRDDLWYQIAQALADLDCDMANGDRWDPDDYEAQVNAVMAVVQPTIDALREVEREHIDGCGRFVECGGDGRTCQHAVTLVDHESTVPCIWCRAERAEAALAAANARIQAVREAEFSEEHRLEDLGQNSQGRGWYWRCRCGWLGLGLLTVEGAAREWRRHTLEEAHRALDAEPDRAEETGQAAAGGATEQEDSDG